jgi:aryl-alcohol dehydrogenase-like predicted oxidoreductase
MKDEQMSRRAFVAGTAATAVGLSSLGAARAEGPDATLATGKILNYNENMEYRRCGKTNLMISAVGLGGHWKRINVAIGAADVSGDRDILEMPEFIKNRHDVVSRCIDAGINYIDACSGREVLAYTRALKGRRDKVYLGYSWYEKEPRFEGWRTTEKLMQSFDEGLREAKLEYVDLWRMSVFLNGSAHPPREVEAIITALEKGKKQGKARFTGIATHDRGWAKMMVESYPEQIDVLHTPYTADTKMLPQNSLFDAVKRHDVGVIGIKPFANNSLFEGDSSPGSPHAEDDNRRARLAIRYVLNNPAITAPIPGLITVEQVDNVVKAVCERRELDLKETAELGTAAKKMWARLPEDYHWLKSWEYA